MKLATIFPGQGAQYVGMGKEFAEQFPAARAVFDRANEVLGYDLAKLCFEGPESELNSTRVSQPALYATSAAVLAVLQERGFDRRRCMLTAGLSLGEYTALHFSGALSFEDGLRLVARRGQFMQDACDARPSGMISVIGLAAADAEAVCRQVEPSGSVGISNINSPDQIVLAGTMEGLAKAAELAKARGARRTVALKVAGAYHTQLMSPADRRLAAELEKTPMRMPEIPVLSNVTADLVRQPDEIKRLLSQQVTTTVKWYPLMQRALDAGATSFYEIGAGTVLAGLMRKIQPAVEVVSIGLPADLSQLAAEVTC